ncbi:MAG: hypothetical protein Q9211_004252, partial [Gyalolechia sp. 1 TL-2023]
MQTTREAFTAARLAVHRRNAPYAWSVAGFRLQASVHPSSWAPRNPFSQCARYNAGGRFPGAAKDHPQEGNNGQESDFIAQQKEKQSQAPWHREGSDTPPVARQRSAGAMTKGKLLTTPSRLLKLIVPLTTIDHNTDRKNVEPLALLVHPQQPLSYLERLIQSELPTVTTARGVEKVPAVHFRAEDSPQDEILPGKTKIGDEKSESEDAADDDDLEESKFEGKTEKTGKLNRKKKTTHVARADGKEPQQPLGEGSVESYSGLGHEAPDAPNNGEEKPFVRWSPSTEIGDFIRDAARGKEFAIEIEGAPHQIRIGVPSFNDRTHYLRQRLRKTSAQILELTAVKRECDIAAHKGAQRVAMGGAGLL